MGAINAKEVPKTSSETENSGGKCDTSTSESNVIQQPEHVSWKNPQSVPISNHMDYEKSTHTLGKRAITQAHNNYTYIQYLHSNYKYNIFLYISNKVFNKILIIYL